MGFDLLQLQLWKTLPLNIIDIEELDHQHLCREGKVEL